MYISTSTHRFSYFLSQALSPMTSPAAPLKDLTGTCEETRLAAPDAATRRKAQGESGDGKKSNRNMSCLLNIWGTFDGHFMDVNMLIVVHIG